MYGLLAYLVLAHSAKLASIIHLKEYLSIKFLAFNRPNPHLPRRRHHHHFLSSGFSSSHDLVDHLRKANSY